MSAAGEGAIIAALTAAGAPYELVDVRVRGETMRSFRRAEAAFRTVFEAFSVHRTAEFIVDGDRRLTYGETAAAAGLRGRA